MCSWVQVKRDCIEGAERIFSGHLEPQVEQIERNRCITVGCAAGKYTSIAISGLKRKGFTHVINVRCDMTTRKNLNYY